MEEYRSPFLLPECTNPEDHNYYPNMHASRSNERCPVHYDGKKVEPQAKEWLKWATYREAYATIEINPFDEKSVRRGDYFLDKMLSTVTATNPPYAPSEPPSEPDYYGIWIETESTGLLDLTIEDAWNWVAHDHPGMALGALALVWVLIILITSGIF